MRVGLPVSVFSHTALIALGLVGLNFAEPLEPRPIEAISVDIVPITEFSNVRIGSLESEVVETLTPSLVETPDPGELAQPTGNTEEDQIKPLDGDEASSTPTEQTAPEPVPPAPESPPVPDAQPDPPPEPVEVPPQEPPAQPPVPVEQPPAPAEVVSDPVEPSEPAPVAPTPVRSASIARLREDFARRQREEAAREADRASAIVNAEETRGATTGQGGQATTGAPTGQSATLTRSEQDALAAQMRRCWRLLPGEIDSGESVRLLVELNRDGSVKGTPRVLSNITTSIQGSIARAAQRAVLGCGPYRLAPEKYANWSQIDVTFRSSDML